MTEAILVTPAGATNGRAKKMLLIGLGVVLVLYVLPKFVLGGGGDDAAAQDVSAADVAAAAPAAPAGEEPVSETLHNFSAKNPFSPAFEETPAGDAGAPAPAATAPTPTAPLPEPVVIVDTGVPVMDTPTAAPAPAPAPSPPPAAPMAPVRFGLVQVGQDASGRPFASVRVDGGVFQAVEGQEFAGRYKVVSLDAASRCGEFLFGDQRFSLCEGEETTT